MPAGTRSGRRQVHAGVLQGQAEHGDVSVAVDPAHRAHQLVALGLGGAHQQVAALVHLNGLADRQGDLHAIAAEIEDLPPPPPAAGGDHRTRSGPGRAPPPA